MGNIHLIGEPNQEKWIKFFAQRDKWMGFCIFNEDESEMMGLALGAVVDNFWDTKVVGKVIAWDVLEEARGWNSLTLMKNLLKWFKIKGVDYVVASCDFDSQAEKIYSKWGFKPLEKTLYLIQEE